MLPTGHSDLRALINAGAAGFDLLRRASESPSRLVDVSARDVLDRDPLQITVSRCPDIFCPVGPHILTAEEVPDVNAHPLELSTRLNG